MMVMILQVLKVTPWNYASIRGHQNIVTLKRIPTRHIRFVPIHQPTDDPTTDLALQNGKS